MSLGLASPHINFEAVLRFECIRERFGLMHHGTIIHVGQSEAINDLPLVEADAAEYISTILVSITITISFYSSFCSTQILAVRPALTASKRLGLTGGIPGETHVLETLVAQMLLVRYVITVFISDTHWKPLNISD